MSVRDLPRGTRPNPSAWQPRPPSPRIPGGTRPRAFVPVDVDRVPADRQRHAVSFNRALAAAGPLLRPDDLDLRVVQKWQFWPSQVTEAERDVLRDLGSWLWYAGLATPPTTLYRMVRVEDLAARWDEAPDAEVLAFALGLRSWATGHDLDAFCDPFGDHDCLRYAWSRPPARAVVLDGPGANAYLETLPEPLYAALAKAGDGTVGFDHDEYLCEPSALTLVARGRKGWGNPDAPPMLTARVRLAR